MAKPLTEQEIKHALESLNGWKFTDDKLFKQFKFGNFKEAAAFIMRLAFEAEALQHHPELFNVYSTVNISLSTHDAGDKVTSKDIDLAKAIDSIDQ